MTEKLSISCIILWLDAMKVPFNAHSNWLLIGANSHWANVAAKNYKFSN